MNVVDLPALRAAAATVLAWSDRTPHRGSSDWATLAEAVRILRAAAGHGRLARILQTLTQDGKAAGVDDALRDLADLAALPRPHRLERAEQLRLPF